MRARALVAIGALVTAGCATVEGPRQTASPVAVGYVPAFKGLDQIVASSAFDHYTHLMLAFVNPAPDGRIVAGREMACMPSGDAATSLRSLRQAVERGHEAGAKVLVSLGGGGIPECSGDWAVLLRPESRDAVVRNLVALADEQDLDGIDVDIEGELLTRIHEEGNFVPFVATLGEAMRARGKLLTTATGSYEGGMVPVESLPWFDLVQVMAYDMIGPTWGTPGDEHSPYTQAERDLALWRSLGVPRERLVLGVPFYGRGFGSYAGRGYGFDEIVAAYGADAADEDVVGERCSGCSYITYNGTETLARKARLARREGAGIMVWEVSEDTDDALLIRTLLSAMGQD